VGTFRYWTVSNLPLFLLASPTLAILLWSAWDCFPAKRGSPTAVLRSQHTDAMYLAAPQFVLAVLAITNYHVQIITRLSSGYPYWYVWLALVNIREPYHPQLVKTVLKWMVLYAAIQAGLYASFLPPA
jgi:GPI mannosyltransferase 2